MKQQRQNSASESKITIAMEITKAINVTEEYNKNNNNNTIRDNKE